MNEHWQCKHPPCGGAGAVSPVGGGGEGGETCMAQSNPSALRRASGSPYVVEGEGGSAPWRDSKLPSRSFLC